MDNNKRFKVGDRVKIAHTVNLSIEDLKYNITHDLVGTVVKYLDNYPETMPYMVDFGSPANCDLCFDAYELIEAL